MFKVNGKEVELIKFPAGEVSPVLRATFPKDPYNKYHIDWRFESTDEVFILVQLVDAIRGCLKVDDLTLNAMYFPFSRQDRRVNLGESNSLKVLCDILKSLNFNRIYTYDAHSLMLSAYLGEVFSNHPQHLLFKSSHTYSKIGKKVLLVSPDQGASKKTEELAKRLLDTKIRFSNVQILQCLKSRDLSNGNVNTLKVFYEGQDFSDFDIVVVDDICDGGATFIAIAQELLRLGIKGKSLILYTSHGIYSKGKSELLNYYDSVDCSYLQSNPKDPYQGGNL